MDYKDCLLQIQKYLENSPLIILGSGASADYGIPLLGEISDEIRKYGASFDANEFTALCDNLVSMNLEDAIDHTSLSDASINTLRRIVWQFINDRDIEFLYTIVQDKASFPLADLLDVVIRSASNSATVVTTNYDRLAEYASDRIEATTVNGFAGNLIKTLDFPSPKARQKRVIVRERIVNIWKAHGSLDWFTNDDGDIISIPLSTKIPTNYEPLIIPPGKGKYSSTHSMPYRDIIAHADTAFTNAGSFLCVGYGFNDAHIQPKLIDQIKRGKPIVVVCRTATEACKANVMTDEVKKFVIIERHADKKTSVSGYGYSEILDGELWQLANFIKTVWR